MANTTGVYRLKNGNWAFRYVITQDGRKKDVKRQKDDLGNPFKTKRDAVIAREMAIAAIKESTLSNGAVRKTVTDVWNEYCEKGRSGKAYQTIRKQDCLWDHYICSRFGSRFIDDISVAEIIDYLSNLYYIENFSYRYVESFLKMFYLIFGQAYSRNYLDVDVYNKLCVNKSTKISMPKRKSEDDNSIVSFTDEQISLLDDFFKGTHAETAYLLGKYCGLRINECFGLKWDHVDLDKGIIYIDRQQQYQDGLIKLVPVKTHCGVRTLYLCDKLRDHLMQKWNQELDYRNRFAAVRKQRQRFIEDLDGHRISSVDLVNCLPDGTIQTVHSMKYPTREIKSQLGFEFKYHYLRHTYGTKMAEMNTPAHLLCNQMGHSNIHITQRYYLAVSPAGIDALQKNLNRF